MSYKRNTWKSSKISKKRNWKTAPFNLISNQISKKRVHKVFFNNLDYKKIIRPKAFLSSVNRIRQGYINKKQKQAEKEYIPRGENLEYYQNLPEKIPSCYTRYVEKKKKPKKDDQILYFDVNIGKGKTGKLGLKPSDDPILKAREFSRIFSLSVEMEEALAEMLIGYQNQMLGQAHEEEYEDEDDDEEDCQYDNKWTGNAIEAIEEDDDDLLEASETARNQKKPESFLKNYSSKVSNYMN
jgi:hypothetical protein